MATNNNGKNDFDIIAAKASMAFETMDDYKNFIDLVDIDDIFDDDINDL